MDQMNENQLVRFRREAVGFIFQSFNLIPSMNALENVALPLSFRGVPKKIRLARAARLLKTGGTCGTSVSQTFSDVRRSAAAGGGSQGVGGGSGYHLCRRAHRESGFRHFCRGDGVDAEGGAGTEKKRW